jgi:hypothetical protein
MKLFTKEIDKKLFDQYSKGNNLESQMVVAKIFNPYGRGTWYILNSDPEDSDYLWAIVDLFEVEIGSVLRSELESIKVPPFRLGLERDTSFRPINAKELYDGLMSGKHYAHGGDIQSSMAKGGYLEYRGTITDDAVKSILQNDFPNANYQLSFNWLNGNRIYAQKDVLQKIRKHLIGEYGIKSEIGGNDKIGLPYIYIQNQIIDKMEHGGSIEDENREMVLNDNNQIIHHTKELPSAIKGKRVPAWVVANVNESANNLSDATHYMDGQKMANGGDIKGALNFVRQQSYLAKTRADKIKWFDKLPLTEKQDLFYKRKGRKISLDQYLKDIDKVAIWNKVHNEDYNNYAHGGSMDSQQGIDLFEDYENIPANVQSVLDNHEDAFMDGDYKELQKALTQLKKIGYTFEYELDGQAYDLRPIGTKGKSEMNTFKDGGEINTNVEMIEDKDGSQYLFPKNSKNKTLGVKFEKGGDVKPQIYIEFLNKKKGFAKDTKHFDSYADAVKWGKENFENFNMDMIKYKFEDGGSMSNKYPKFQYKGDNRFYYYVVDENEDTYTLVAEDKLDLWENAKQPDKSIYYEEIENKDEMEAYVSDKMAKGGKVNKVAKVMHEFKEGNLHSGKSEKIVTNPKQAIAIALSEAKNNQERKGWKHKK